jgi:outer membrane protein assembly factor BamB
MPNRERPSAPHGIGGFQSLLAALLFCLAVNPIFAIEPAEWLVEWAGCDKGLCVHVGCGTGELVGALAQQGEFFVEGLESDRDRVTSARNHLAATYGVTSVRQSSLKGLPYAENLVNLVVADNVAEHGTPLNEILRVLRPGGAAIVGQNAEAAHSKGELTRGELETLLRDAGIAKFDVREQNGVWARFEKPWPTALDGWTHARYDATGNAVSTDSVSSPPRRIRWIAGPMRAAGYQISAGGRNYYAGIIARDAFNGMRLWSRSISPAPLGATDPVATDDLLFVVHQGKLQAWDAESGETLKVYDAAGTPDEVFHHDGMLIVVDADSVRALDVATGKQLWRRSASIPGCVAVSEESVFYVRGNPRRGEKCEVLRLDRATGAEVWRRGAPRFKPDPDEYAWLNRATKSSHSDGMLAIETSTYTDFAEGNGIHVLSAEDGSYLCGRSSEPGGHYGQSRALFVDELLWTRDGRNTEGMDPRTGEIVRTYPVGTGHCFPPVATPKYMIAGEMHFTDLADGGVDAHRISKGTCSRDTGFVPANGLVYVAPKNCVCWPMVKGFVALAPERPGGSDVRGADELPEARLEVVGKAKLTDADADDCDWPCYRGNAWRSGSTTMELPVALESKWTRPLGTPAANHLIEDWQYNPFVRGPVTAPIIADGRLLVARPDAHEIVALNVQDGSVLWRFTADGRVDTPPTTWRGLCVFGTRNGWVYCLQTDTGEVAWRLHAAAGQEQIVAFGQTESPWPVAGSVLIVDGTAYFAAGRQYLAEGGVRVFSVDVETGQVRWMKCVNDLPDHHYYAASSLEFDNYDLMVREGETVAMSRWLFDMKTGDFSVQPQIGFACYGTGSSGVVAARGHWSYGPRMGRSEDRIKRRPLLAFRDGMLISSTDDRLGLFRREFTPDACEQFDREWYSYRKVSRVPVDGGELTQTERLLHDAQWKMAEATEAPIDALVLAGEFIYCATEDGKLTVFSAGDGRQVATHEISPVVWDGMAAANDCLYVSTKAGDIVCLGEPDPAKQ